MQWSPSALRPRTAAGADGRIVSETAMAPMMEFSPDEHRRPAESLPRQTSASHTLGNAPGAIGEEVSLTDRDLKSVNHSPNTQPGFGSKSVHLRYRPEFSLCGEENRSAHEMF